MQIIDLSDLSEIENFLADIAWLTWNPRYLYYMIETFNFLSNLPLRELYQYDKKAGGFYAWKFDGLNQVGEKYFGETKDAALKILREK